MNNSRGFEALRLEYNLSVTNYTLLLSAEFEQISYLPPEKPTGHAISSAKSLS
jgi:hypothetical protein